MDPRIRFSSLVRHGLRFRSRFELTKGHAAPVLYCALADCGYTRWDELNTLRKLGSVYQGHPDVRFIPALEASTGSLGEGLSLGIGMALVISQKGCAKARRVLRKMKEPYFEIGSVVTLKKGRERVEYR